MYLYSNLILKYKAVSYLINSFVFSYFITKMTTKLHIWLRFSEVLNWFLLRIRSIYFIHVEDIKYLFRGTIFCSTSSFLCIHFSVFKDNSTFYMQSENILRKICKIL